MSETKPFCISKQAVFEAWQKIKVNKGAAGVDGVTIEGFEKRLEKNLYKIWNRMSSGTYFPLDVRMVSIPKSDGGERTLGIPTVGDRVAQMVLKLYLEPTVEAEFHQDSYGYRPLKSATEAVGVVRKRCWEYSWVVDLDIQGFFDNIDHSLMMHAVRKHTTDRWMLLYIERWMKASGQKEDGTIVVRDKGTPQGGVVSPLLANIFLHHVFDKWMEENYPSCPFERYADDIVIHCNSEKQAKYICNKIKERLKSCKLSVHPNKTKIVYCKEDSRKGNYPKISFDFLGYTFRPRRAMTRRGRIFIGFLPAISNKASKRIVARVRKWKIHLWSSKGLTDLSRMFNGIIRGWCNYYGAYYKTGLRHTFECLNRRLVRWVTEKYKRFRKRPRAASQWLRAVANRQPSLFRHWEIGIKP